MKGEKFDNEQILQQIAIFASFVGIPIFTTFSGIFTFNLVTPKIDDTSHLIFLVDFQLSNTTKITQFKQNWK